MTIVLSPIYGEFSKNGALQSRRNKGNSDYKNIMVLVAQKMEGGEWLSRGMDGYVFGKL
jgi:hypothetical protein